MLNFSLNNFEKFLKNYKIFLDGILIVNLISFVVHVIGSIIIPILYNNRVFIGQSALILKSIEHYASFIPGPIAILSFFLYFIISRSISTKIPDHKLREIFKSIKSLNNLSFILLILFFYPIVIFYFISGSIIYLGLFFTSYNKLRKKEIYKLMRKDLILGLISYVIGGLLSFLFIILFSFRVNIGPGFVLIGIVLMNKKVVPYFSLKNSERLSNLEKIQHIVSPSKISGQISENIAKQDPEKKVIKTEFKPDFVKKPEISIQEETHQPIPETMTLKADVKTESTKQQEIAIKEEIPKPIPAITVLKKEPKSDLVKQTRITPEEEITPKKMKTKKRGLFSFKFDRKNVLKKPIRSKIIQKEAQSQILKKKCPFCGKEHDDLNVKFCYACGYKF